ncbi:MAG: TM2 domain-containing protein [Hyphomonas sp.]
MSLSTNDMIYVEQRVANSKKSPAAAYLLWFFLGCVSAHRFYLGKWGTALLQIVSYLFLIGFVWWVVDFFLIPSIIEDDADDKRYRYAREMRYAY